MKKSTRVALFALLAFGSLIFALRIFFRPLSQDEGVFLTIGQGIANGMLPYRDFFDHKTPGIHLLFATTSAILPNNDLLPKILLLAIDILVVLLTAKLARRLGGNGWIASLAMLLLLLFFEGNRLIAEPFLALCLVISVYLVTNAILKPQNTFLAGVAIGAAVLFKQTAIISALGLMLWLLISSESKSRIKQLFSFLLGFLLVIAVLYVYLDINKLLALFWQQAFELNFSSYPREPLLAVLQGLLMPFVLTLPIWGGFFGYLIRWMKLGRPEKGELIVIFLAILPIPFFFVRHYPHYWLQIAPFVAILASFMTPPNLSLHSQKERGLATILSLVWLTLTLVVPIKDFFADFPKFFEKKRIANNLRHYEGEYLLAENQFIGYYFLADKKPINQYLYITEINDWSESAEQQTIEELKKQPGIPILWPSDPNFAYAKRLQEYVLEHHKITKDYNEIGASLLMRD